MNIPNINDPELPTEMHFRKGRPIMDHIRNFTSTEKVIFGFFVALATVSAVTMAFKVNSHFLTEIPGEGGTLREGVVGLPHTINPVLAVTDADRDLTALVYSGLMRYKHGKIVPDLAQSFEISADGLIYTFKLKPNLKFQDGEPLTTEDIAFTIQKIQDPAIKSPRASDWKDVKIITTSPEEIQFVLKKAYGPFINNTTVGIIPKHIWSSVRNEQFVFDGNNITPIGSGPYFESAITKDSKNIPIEYHLKTWNGYYGNKPHISSIIFTFFSDDEQALNAFKNGSIDGLSSVSTSQAAEIARSDDNKRIITAPLPRIFAIFFNTNQNPVLAEKSVRTALDMTVDRDLIVKNILNGYGSAINGPLPTNRLEPKTSEMASTSASTTAISSAQALLEKNGWKKNASGIYEKKIDKSGTKTLSLDIYTADIPDLKQTSDIVKKAWTALGAEVNVKIFDSSDLYQNIVRTRKYDALLFGELIGKDNDIYAFWHSSQRTSPGLNVAMYTNSKVDKLLEDLRTTSDPTARENKYIELDGQIREDLPAIFLYSPDFLYIVPKKIFGVSVSNVSLPSDRWNDVGEWYITTEKVWNIFAKNINN